MSFFGKSEQQEAAAKRYQEAVIKSVQEARAICELPIEDLLSKLEAMKAPRTQVDHAIIREVQSRLEIMKLVLEYRSVMRNQ